MKFYPTLLTHKALNTTVADDIFLFYLFIFFVNQRIKHLAFHEEDYHQMSSFIIFEK